MASTTLLTLPAPNITPLSPTATAPSQSTTTTNTNRVQISTGIAPPLSTGPASQTRQSTPSTTSISETIPLITTAPDVTSTSNPAAGFQEASGSQSKKQAPVGLIVGLLLGLLVLVALALFFTRRYLIHRRQRRITPAKARMGLAISGPTNFQHITGGLNALEQSGSSSTPGGHPRGTAEMSKADLASAYSPSRQKGDDQTAMRRGDLTSSATLNRDRTPVTAAGASGSGIGGSRGGAAEVWATFDSEVGEGNATSSQAIRKKYSFDFNTLESGLSNHMDTIKAGQKSPRLHGQP